MKLSLAIVLIAGMLKGQTESFDDLARRAQSLVDTDPSQAAALFRKALSERPGWAEGWFYLGGVLSRLGRYKEAVEVFHKGLDLSPNSGTAWGFLGIAEYEAGNFKDALEAIDKGEKSGLGSNAGFQSAVRVRAARVLIRSSMFDQAMDQLQPLAQNQENSTDVVEAAGLCALGIPADYASLPEARRKVVDSAGKAMWAATSQRPKDAKEGFDELLAKYPNEPGVHYAAGLFYMDSDQRTALQEFRKELAANPDHWPALLVSAFLETREGSPDTAIGLVERARKFAPSTYGWLCDAEMGRALLAKDQPEKAGPMFESSVKLRPENAQTHFYLEQAYRRVGRKADAQKEHEEFVRLKSLQDPLSVPGITKGR